MTTSSAQRWNDTAAGGVPIRIRILVGGTRSGRKAAEGASWVGEHDCGRAHVCAEILDPRVVGLPVLDEEMPPAMGRYQQPRTSAWAEKAGFVLVTPGYNHSVSLPSTPALGRRDLGAS